MRTAVGVAAVLGAAALALAAPGPAATPAREVLPVEGLVPSSIAVLRGPADLDAHYYLADESALGLGRRTDAVLARYKAGAGEALLLVVAYPGAKEAGRVYRRFGTVFFPGSFDPASARIVRRIETGDWAGAACRGRYLIVILESPDRDSCEGLLRRAEDRAPAAETR